MHTEMYLTNRALQALQTDHIEAPLYRIPVAMFTAALPKLIGEGRLLSHEIPILVEYLNRIEELNRGLERAGAARAAEQPVLVREEFGRNLEKARGLLEPDKRFADSSIFDAAEETVFRLEGAFHSNAWTASDADC